ncbi:MAG: hypothetical protein B6244_09660 [Candidatus Cloacimonetes bacterium 4572_55]|nr:MAG: hypothetical protein B6244_09660 [Candidatus Cloacimonetes bacterium 4572_55]
MILGKVLIIIGFLFALISAVLYGGMNYKKFTSDQKRLIAFLARIAYYLIVISVTVASVYLMYLIFTHNFEVKYIYSYSSSDLHIGYLISSFWAGQEGSFLLWLLFLVWMGVVFIKTSRRLVPIAMIFLNLIVIFFLILLMKISPFTLLPGVPQEGAGLNPLLQNPWMVIHPPILFIGFAAATFPFIIALAALIKRDYGEWIIPAFPWTIFASITLGAGIILGAFWSYEVLGWGGYWGWDPVENSSLIPWMVSIALIHSFAAQRQKGVLQRTNFILSISFFVLVIYSTFLTRSGVLQDFSVHSFTDLGNSSILSMFLTSFLTVGLALFLWRFPSIPSNPVDFSRPNRQNMLVAGIITLMASTTLIFIGTSSPILTSIFGDPAQVDISYYNRVNFPFGVIMVFLMGLTSFLFWTESDQSVIKRLIPSLILTLISAAMAFLFKITGPSQLVFITASAFAFWSGGIVFIRQLRSNWAFSGAALSHLGLGLMFAGILISGTMEQSEILTLDRSDENTEPTEALGYQFIYTGLNPMPDGKDMLGLQVLGGETVFHAQPRFYLNDRERGMMREPDIMPTTWFDLYISPLEIVPGSDAHSPDQLLMTKGDRLALGGYDIYFEKFVMGGDHEQSGNFSVKALLRFSKDSLSFDVSPFLRMTQEGMESEPVPFPEEAGFDGEPPTIKLLDLNADQRSIRLEFNNFTQDSEMIPGKPEQVIVQVSKKPFMSALWLGSILCIVGFTIGLYRRIRYQ